MVRRKGVDPARRRRRAMKNAAKAARMSRRLVQSAQKPFQDLPDGSSKGVEDMDETQMMKFQRLTEATPEEGREAERLPEEKAVNLSLIPADETDIENFRKALSSHSNILFSPSFGVDALPIEIVTEHIREHIFQKHRAQKNTDGQIKTDSDVITPDSGFTNNSVLLILPSRNLALQYVQNLLKGYETVEKLEQFESDYSLKEPEDPKLLKLSADHQQLFGGNVDDRFCFGITLFRKKAVLYAEYTKCDLLVASPLGLAHYLGIGAEGSGDVPEKSFLLASVELLVVPMLEVLLMQNWARVQSVIEVINKPLEMRDTSQLGDFRRLKPQFIEGTSKKHRQNIFLSLFPHPYFKSLFRSVTDESVLGEPQEIDGSPKIPTAVESIPLRVRQYFLRVPATSMKDAHQERLKYFTEKLYHTRLQYYLATRTPLLVIVPTYYQYVGVRAFFEENLTESYSDVCEYTSQDDFRRALRNFNTQQVHILLTTERYYFYKRHLLKGISVLIWYAPPVFPQFYVEYMHAVSRDAEASCVITLFSKYDAHALLRIVGPERAGLFLDPKADTDVFCVH